MEEFRSALAEAGIGAEHLRADYDEVQTDRLEDVVRKGLDELRAKGLKDFVIDDSGMFVDALNGFPGVYSAYVQRTIGNRGILGLMEGREDRGAEFRCCIGCDMDGETVIVSGICRGRILTEERGSGGFGYDPVFSPDGRRSFAEMPLEEKNSVSHRGRAIKALVEGLRGRGL